MAAHGTNVAKQFEASLLKKFFPKTWAFNIAHDEFKAPGGDSISPRITEKYSQYQILDVTAGALQNYTGADLTANEPTEVASTLTIDQFQAVHEQIKNINLFKSQIKNPNSSLIEQHTEDLKQALEVYALGFWTDAASGNWVGTSYTTGTVTVTVTTGAVTGSGTTFTAAMVGKPFRAAGHTKWFRVKTYTSATAIVIEDDSDDETSVYTGGAISAGAAYEIQANTALAVTGSNILDTLQDLGVLLDEANAPIEGRYIILPFKAKKSIVSSTRLNPVLVPAYDKNIVNGLGYKDTLNGFDIYFSRFVPGNNTSGYQIIAGHKSFLALGFGMLSPMETIKPENNFGNKIKGLFGYGGKVADGRRNKGTMLFATFAA